MLNVPVTLLGPATAVSAVAEQPGGDRVQIPCCTATGLVMECLVALQCGLCARKYAVAPLTSSGENVACVCCGVQLGGPLYGGQLHMPGLL